MNRFIYSSQHFYAVNIVTMLKNIMKMRYIKRVHSDFPGNTVLKALCFHCKRHRLDTAAKKKKKRVHLKSHRVSMLSFQQFETQFIIQ